MGTNLIRAVLLASASAGAFVAVAPTAAYAQEQSYDVNIPAQSLGDALRALGRATKQNIVFDGTVVRGKRSVAVRGRMSAGEALQQMLSGSGLVMARGVGGALTVKAGNGNAASGGAADTTVNDYSGISEILVVGSSSQNADIRRTRDDSLPYVVFGKSEIENSGATTIEDFFRKKLTVSTATGTNTQLANAGTGSSISLRGLNQSQTLILVDGRRLASVSIGGSPLQPDLNGIPMLAIERIEVLPASASGIYGGNATAGVINIILRRDFDGLDAQIRIDGTTSGGGESRRIDLGYGFSLEGGKTRILLSGSYETSDPLYVGDRGFLQRARALLARNNPSALYGASVPPLGTTTNICSAAATGLCTTTPLVLKNGTNLGSSITFVPLGYSGPTSDNGAAFFANAGSFNLGSPNTTQTTGGSRQSLLNNPSRKTASANIKRSFGSSIDAFADLSYAQTRGKYYTNVFGSFVIPANAPSNPFNQAVRVTTPTFGADAVNTTELTHYRISSGLTARLSPEWSIGFDYAWDRTTTSAIEPPTALNAVVNAALESGVINIFRDTNTNSISFSEYVDPTSQFVTTPTRATLNDATLRFGGPLPVRLPGGKILLNGLLEHRSEKIGFSSRSSATQGTFYPERWQNVDSAYAELRLPLLSPITDGTLPLLEITAAGRFDRYKTVGANTIVVVGPGGIGNAPVVRTTNKFETFNPTISAKLVPIKGIQLRGSYSTGFLPPSVAQIVPTLTTINLTPLAPFGFVDPKRGNEPIGGGQPIALASGGNADLRPERSHTLSAGVILQPVFAPGLRMSADWVSIKKRDTITSPFFLGGPFSAFEYEEQIPGLVIRGPANNGFPVGPVTQLANRLLVNSSRESVGALDLSLDYYLPIDNSSSLTFSGSATYQYKYDIKLLPDSVPQDLIGSNSLPWIANGYITWESGRASITWSSAYFSSHWINISHTVDVNQGAAKVGDQMYHDITMSYKLSSGNGTAPKVDLTLGILNLLNRQPSALLSNIGGYYDYLGGGDPRGRRFYIALRGRF